MVSRFCRGIKNRNDLQHTLFRNFESISKLVSNVFMELAKVSRNNLHFVTKPSRFCQHPVHLLREILWQLLLDFFLCH